MSKTAEERGHEMMSTPMNKLPQLARDYCSFLCKEYGMCGEVCLTAYCHYASYIEGLKSTKSLYRIDKQGKDWFNAHKEEVRNG